MVKGGPVLDFNESYLRKFSGIVLINAHKKPPHIGFYSCGKYFSLTTNEVQVNQDLGVLFELINRKKIPSLFVTFNKILDNSKVIDVFENYSDLSSGITCISPIKKIVTDLFQEDVSQIEFVYQLIPFLEKANHVSSFSHVYCEDLIRNNFFTLTTYTMSEVVSRIKSLAK